MYKLVVSDMDGSLLNSHDEISDYNKRMVQEAIKKGTIFVLATGRIYGSAKVYAKQLKLNTPIMACNGGIIRNSIDGKILYDVPIDKKAFKAVLDFLKKTDTYYHFYGADIFYAEEIRMESYEYSVWNKSLPKEDQISIQEIANPYDLIDQDSIYKVLLHCNNNMKREYYSNELNKISNITLTSSWFDNFEICGRNVTKGNAVRRFAEGMNIKPDEIICIGDNLNDISMIDYAGLGVAMGNADEAVKKAADVVTSSNDEDGVGRVLEKYVI
ncbi:MAG: Cof-type HAD-IIB family hydrolase [Clostridia bacterium]|nr:Cof-type HAD-IIB family hydrolase [Clostridia bacterium]